MKLALLAAACTWAMVAAPAFAQTGPTPSVSLRYGGLDLSRPEDAETMLRRIDRAASQVCGRTPDIRDIPTLGYYRACVRQATDDAVARLNAPLVTSLHWGRKDQPVRVARR